MRGIPWQLQRIKFYGGSLFKFFPAPLFCCIKLPLLPLWTVVTSVVIGEGKKVLLFLLFFGQKWLCYSAVLAQNALQGVSWLINSPEIGSLQPLWLWVQQWEGLPLGRSLERAVLPTQDHHVNTKRRLTRSFKNPGKFHKRENRPGRLLWFL